MMLSQLVKPLTSWSGPGLTFLYVLGFLTSPAFWRVGFWQVDFRPIDGFAVFDELVFDELAFDE